MGEKGSRRLSNHGPRPGRCRARLLATSCCVWATLRVFMFSSETVLVTTETVMPASFTRDLTAPFSRRWASLLEKFSGRPNVHGMEIGCLESRSSIWFLENILQHESSHLTCIDPWCRPRLVRISSPIAIRCVGYENLQKSRYESPVPDQLP